ncbi:MAG: hypothetical protein R3B97_05510 [Dehalococcoidia bacterium]|nr:hypothetical protein [Dehalococcoidia bacterium]MCB9486800.1 hypothetical protein [Thermoflexaceae bacterium]
MDMQLLMVIVLPLLGIAGGVVGWRAAGKNKDLGRPATGWQDDSLEAWRKDREQAAAEDRELRAKEREERLAAGHAEEEVETVRQQRIGG